MGISRITYRFGRGGFRNFEEGIAKEWLLSNGIGGYANSSINGSSSRIFSAYLIASLHPPVDRVLVLAKTHEELEIKRADGIQLYDFAAQEYPGWKREGYRYLSSFSYDIVPEYCYEAGGVSICKRIALEYGKNAVALEYEIKNGSSPAKLCITPLFNYRPFGEVVSKEGLEFEVSLSEQNKELVLFPKKEKNVKIVFQTSEGSFFDRAKKLVSMATPNYLIEENELYSIDVSNGFTGVDQHYTPYEVQISLAPNEKKRVYLLCELLARQNAEAVEAQNEEPVMQNENFQKLQNNELRNLQNEESAIQSDNFQKFQNNKLKNPQNEESAMQSEKSKGVQNRAQRIFRECQERAETLLERAKTEDAFTGRLVLSADHFLVKRESTDKMTILAGYPWFADWGRDTMIAFTGLTLATGRFEEAAQVLESFAAYVSKGMIPNVFPNTSTEEPMYNTIDASLWYFYAAYQYLCYTSGGTWNADSKDALSKEEQFIKEKIYPALAEILCSYRDGQARYGIRMDEDGLITGGDDLDQLTWMDVRVGDLVVTPRHGKAVEINALWYNALKCMELFAGRLWSGETTGFVPAKECRELAQRTKDSFSRKFWNQEKGCLYDGIGLDKEPDGTFRPNQIYAVSLPFTMLDKEQEKQIVQNVYEKLYTPYGLRSLAPDEPGYKKEYKGKLINRDLAYHMGTAWAYLSGAFLTAWLKTGGEDAREEARKMCLCFFDHMVDGCLGGIAEIFDGDYACDSRGCYTQAWSVGEILRAWREINNTIEK